MMERGREGDDDHRTAAVVVPVVAEAAAAAAAVEAALYYTACCASVAAAVHAHTRAQQPDSLSLSLLSLPFWRRGFDVRRTHTFSVFASAASETNLVQQVCVAVNDKGVKLRGGGQNMPSTSW